MAFCKNCGGPFDWGYDVETGRWIPLEPIVMHEDLEKSYVDEKGVLRADHRDRCRGKTVNVTRLSSKVPPEMGELAPKETPKPPPYSPNPDLIAYMEGGQEPKRRKFWFWRNYQGVAHAGGSDET